MKSKIICIILALMLLTSCATEISEHSSEESDASESVVSALPEESKSTASESEESNENEPSEEETKVLTKIKIGDKEAEIDKTHYNKEIYEDGVYLYDGSFDGTRTVKGEDIVIVNGKVVYIVKEGIAMIPDAGGIVVTFYNEEAGGINIGDDVVTEYDTLGTEGEFVEINGIYFPVDFKNGIRAPESVTVYYDANYGESTGTNVYGVDITVEDGRVTKINREGNSAIPADGYVLSIHKDSEYYKKVSKIHIGNDASYLKTAAYGIYELEITAVGGTRTENSLVLYKSGKTGTNQYGFEIVVENGKTVSASAAGNASVPENGYVLSGHGTNAEKLREIYKYGLNVIIDEASKKATVVSSPHTLLYGVENEITEFENLTENAKSELKDLDYDFLYNAIDGLDDTASHAKKCLESYDYKQALDDIYCISEKITSLSYSLYEQSPVANKAVWYRSYAKSDEEVEKEINEMVSLGFNTVFLETWYNGRFVGFSDNDLITHHTSENGDYDLLEGYVKIAHEYGIELHAWVHDFFIGTVEAQEETDHNLAEHFRDRWIKDKSGKENFFYTASNTNFIFIDPSDEEYTDLLSELYNQIITEYGVDGIHLDYIRFPEKNGDDDFGYNDNIIFAWHEKEGTDVDPRTLKSGTVLWKSWVKFRQDIITSFVRRIYSESKDANPDIIVSAAIYPGIPTVKNDIFQDVEAWINEGIIDYVLSMSYGDNYGYVKNNIQKFVELTDGKCLYTPGISAFTDTADDVFANIIDTSRGMTNGVGVFSLNYIGIEGYAGVISAMMRVNAVHTYEYGVTVSAYMNWIKSKSDGIYKEYGGLKLESGIISAFDGIASDADDFGNGDGKTAEEKKKYLKEVTDDLSGLLSEIKLLEKSKGRDALVNDMENLNDILTVLLNMTGR